MAQVISRTPPHAPAVTDDGAAVSDRALVRMLAHFLAPYRGQIALILLMLLGVTLLSLLPPYLVQRAVDGPIAAGDLAGLVPYGVIYLAGIVVLFALRFAHVYMLQTVGQGALTSLRQTLFEHILRQDMRYFNTTPVGQIVARFDNDIDALTELVSTSFVVVFSNLVTLVGIIVVMFAINWRMALLSLAVFPFMLGGTIYFRTKIRDASKTYHHVVGEMLAFLNEQFGGMTIVQLFRQQARSRDDFAVRNHQFRDVHNVLRDEYTFYASMLQILTSAGLALVLFGGGQGVLLGWTTLGTLIAFVEYTRRSFEPVLQLSEQFAQIQTAFSAGERIARMLNVQPSIADPVEPTEPQPFQRTFRFDHVEFGYEADHRVLHGVDFHVGAGKRVAIVGATGAGKSSLAGLLARFYDVDAGRVLIDDTDVRDLSLVALRQRVTVVPQNPYCFQGTIADNLDLFDPSITREQMIAAARAAAAAPFIERLPQGYDTMLLPGGANLSQGQRQLLALARALIHNPDSILVLDEATSSIDTETEAAIQEGLGRVLQGRTSLIIAHRLSTVRDADRILVMQRGRIVEDGNHESLLKAGGLYAKLYQRQFVAQAAPAALKLGERHPAAAL